MSREETLLFLERTEGAAAAVVLDGRGVNEPQAGLLHAMTILIAGLLFLVLVLIIIGLLSPQAIRSRVMTALVIEVTDGDSLVVKLKGKRRRVRLWGIDSPEGLQEGGPQARQFTEKKVLGKNVTMTKIGTDMHGRILAKVSLDGDKHSVNSQIVEAGWAWNYGGDYKFLEERARQARRGVWAKSNPENPYEWRRRHGN